MTRSLFFADAALKPLILCLLPTVHYCLLLCQGEELRMMHDIVGSIKRVYQILKFLNPSAKVNIKPINYSLKSVIKTAI